MLIRGHNKINLPTPKKTIVALLIFRDWEAEVLVFPFTPIFPENLDTKLSHHLAVHTCRTGVLSVPHLAWAATAAASAASWLLHRA